MNLISALGVLALVLVSIPGLIFVLVDGIIHYKPDPFDPIGIFKKNILIISVICYFLVMGVALVLTATYPLSSEEKPQYKPVQEQLYRRVEP